jgi:flagellar hook-associated protein 2
MGTVGLNFGSPTSGAGFNVSSTVAEIIGNLQNVETLWKTQLTTLQSQDTAISSLGISVNNDGSLTFDAGSLDSVLNSDYSGVAGFFQNVNSWGQAFLTMLTHAGSSSTTGILSLSLKSDSSVESTLNAEITKENALISAQQISLTTELNTANQIMQELPTQLEGVNELYSAITGYNQNLNG